MEISPLDSFDVDHLEPTAIEVVLHLPRLSREDMRESTWLFSRVLATASCYASVQQPAALAEILCRCLLAAADELIHRPESLLGHFRGPQHEPWFQRQCEILAPSLPGAEMNRNAISRMFDEWEIDDVNRQLIKSAAIVLAVGSLVTTGRLPLQQQPDKWAMN
ncbi:MAG: hypothetical protein CMJ58_00130 [Planctomycetaceae bacterium]|nr:hypothetical protein [Planctomycetaceae bacterium]